MDPKQKTLGEEIAEWEEEEGRKNLAESLTPKAIAAFKAAQARDAAKKDAVYTQEELDAQEAEEDEESEE